MKRLLFVSLIIAVLLPGCATYRALRSGPAATQAPAFAAGGGVPEQPPAPADAERTATGAQAPAVERLVIQNADLAIVVADVDARMKAVEALAAELGGYVVSSSKYQTYDRSGVQVPEAQVNIRVPAGKLDQALERIKSDVVEVQTESRTGQDVTADYIDQQSRLKNLEATEAQLVKIMQSTTAADDTLNVFNQLTSIREQIEVVKGQIKYYEESAALSAVSVRIVAEASIQPIEVAGWKPKGVARDAIQDLIFFFQDFVNFLIRLVLLVLPALVLIAIPVYLVFLGLRALVRRFRKPKLRPQAPDQPEK
ncbi:MAG: DUF4349 domain-containing protein [Bacteroidota bacterium]